MSMQNALPPFAAALLFAALSLAISGCDSPVDGLASPLQVAASVGPGPTDEASIRAFCADCHGMPKPSSFTKERWHHEVEQGFRLYEESQRTDLVVPDFDATLAWFESAAPEKIEFEAVDGSDAESRFVREQIAWTAAAGVTAISHIRPLGEGHGVDSGFAIADMASGHLWQAMVAAGGFEPTLIGRVANPAHIEPADLDGDGIRDYVVADLGGFNPENEARGALWWFHGQSDGTWMRRPLRMGLVRVSDVRPFDHDGDGDTDLLVAEFGWRFVGSVYLLTNNGVVDGIPDFQWSVVDDRPGGIHLPITNLDDDAAPDFIGLISQHYESIVAYRNRGQGKFEQQRIYSADDPSFGSSGIQLVDLDSDGDLDVVYSNGDTFDDFLAKPAHAIHWLENKGAFPYEHHKIANMPGVYRALAGDLDGDGDQDIAAVSLLTEENTGAYPSGTFDGVAWFEQTREGDWVRHRLQVDHCESASCLLLDWDGDSDLDLLTAPFRIDLQPTDALTLYRNTTNDGLAVHGRAGNADG